MKTYIPAQTQVLPIYTNDMMVSFGFSTPGDRIGGDYLIGGNEGGNASGGY